MTKASLDRILNDTLSQVEAACLAGRGEDLLHDHFRRTATDFANTVFLQMDKAVSEATSETIDGVWSWLQNFPDAQGLVLVEAVEGTLRTFGTSAEQTAAGMKVTATAYAERMNHLLDASSVGRSC